MSDVNTDGPQAGGQLISLGLFADFNRIAWYLLSIYIYHYLQMISMISMISM